MSSENKIHGSLSSAIQQAKLQQQDKYKELVTSGNKLSGLYNNFRDATTHLKDSFDNLRQREDETEILRQKYYDMLTKKAYCETERNAYFKQEETVRDMKDMYVAETRKETHKCSMYVAYSKHHSEKLEDFVQEMWKDIDGFHADCKSLRQQKDEYRSQCVALQKEIHTCEDSITGLKDTLRTLENSKTCLENQCTQFDLREKEMIKETNQLVKTKGDLESTIESMKENYDVLNDKNEGCTESLRNLDEQFKESQVEVSALKEIGSESQKKIYQLEEIIEKETLKSEQLTKQRDELKRRAAQLNYEVIQNRELIVNLKNERDVYQEEAKTVKKERNVTQENCEKMKKEKNILKEQHRLILIERDLVGKEKDRLVSQEYRSRKRNQELMEDHKFLTKQAEEIREKYRRADERAKKDGSLKQDLRDTIKKLHKQIEDERKRMIKSSRDMRTQTDPNLACESRDTVIQQTQMKMKQALRARDQAEKEKRNFIILHDRARFALEKKTKHLGDFESHINKLRDTCSKLEEKLENTERLLTSANTELKKERTKKEINKKMVIDEEIAGDAARSKKITNFKDFSCQTMLGVPSSEIEMKMSQQLYKLHERFQSNELDLINTNNDLSNALSKHARMEKSFQQERLANDILRRKINYIERRFSNERYYMKEIQDAVSKRSYSHSVNRGFDDDPIAKLMRKQPNKNNRQFFMAQESEYSDIQPLSCGSYGELPSYITTE